VRGGGKVVKNAAGFDLPKLMVGSLGRLGVLVELTFKVFPSPEAYVTLKLDYPHLEVALTDIYRLTNSSLELHGLDLEPMSERGGDAKRATRSERREAGGKNHWLLWARLGGLNEAMPARIDRLREFLLKPKGGATGVEVIKGTEEGVLWQQVKEFSWVPAGWALVKVPLTLKRIAPWEAQLNSTIARRRYSAGGNVVWVAWPNAKAETWSDPLNSLLARLELSGLVLLGPPDQVRLGANPGEPFARRIKQALDPGGRFLEL
jgi:glycolate oxidase FAD binding subunit